VAAQKNCYVCELSSSQAKALRQGLIQKGFEFREVPYSEWSAFTKNVNMTLYKEGKLVVQGKGTPEFVQYYLEPEILKSFGFGYEAMLAEESGHSHIGVDESGKGDFFGPLVVAAVYVKKEQLGKLVDLGVKDSKKLSAVAIERLSKIVRELCEFSLVVMGPDKYNQLYEKFKNLNRLLAWGHARAIENLLDKVDCQSVVIDQFGGPHLVLNALMEKGKKVELKQMHHGESDMAVAAASIVARNEFVTRLEELGKNAGVVLPRGSGPAVKETANALAQKIGKEEMAKLAKMHFAVLTPEKDLPSLETE
jgi:ribonuclease HIII